jgi:hypothetical protein
MSAGTDTTGDVPSENGSGGSQTRRLLADAKKIIAALEQSIDADESRCGTRAT